MSQSLAHNDDQLLEDLFRKVLLSPVYDVAQETDLDRLNKLSSRVGNHIWLKREDQQPVHSFKLRGAYQCLYNLTTEQKQAGVVAASAGNHAQGVALSAKKLGIKATIVMPETTPDIKVSAVQRHGANVILHGKNFDTAKQRAEVISQKDGATLIPPFDHPDVIAGQGTVAKEMLQQHNHLDTIFIPVGGGGLLAGMALYIKKVMPQVKVVAVESEDSACLQYAFEQGKPSPLSSVGIFADGVAVKQIGDLPFDIATQYCDDLITVTSDEVCAALKDIFEDVRAIAEPSGALALAGLKKYAAKHQLQQQNLAAVLSGANLNFDTLRYVSERCELGEKKEAVLAVTIPERKGAFKQFCHALGGRVITEFNYRFNHQEQAQIFVGIRLRQGESELTEIKQTLAEQDYRFDDLSDDEVAKLHIRYMVGGSSQAVQNERLYSFEFPEYPGALMSFLNTLGEHWNITLFHYRNHGAAFGQVLAGFEVSTDEEFEFHRHLKALGFAWQDETDNLGYQRFMR
ncbi:threonine ammonia-lyase, biosynthetic [Algicola sagamiensis]|uniref:threonine ammonia-lyase, biosynthetic n=1 Tax=Algicola sagamiensis TaxID=163869 RepID=UPI000380519A|nr:threonine ammonia-lyase, biosynthetic [Algicola sagamiensis]